MQMQWVKVTRGFWHAGKAWGEGEKLEVDSNTATLLRGNQNVVYCDAPAAPAPLTETAIEDTVATKKSQRGKVGA